jgi:hypothetical protein
MDALRNPHELFMDFPRTQRVFVLRKPGDQPPVLQRDSQRDEIYRQLRVIHGGCVALACRATTSLAEPMCGQEGFGSFVSPDCSVKSGRTSGSARSLAYS